MRIGLSVYGTTYGMGLNAASGRPTITAQQLAERALAAGLAGIELPLALLQNADKDALARYAQEHELFITLATGGYDTKRLIEALQLAKQLGALTVRTVLGGAKLGGDRRHMVGRWRPFLEEALVGLRPASVVAEQLGINLAVENHQDLASEELLWLCKSIASPRFGIVLDTGNPLATAEDPVAFTESIAPYLKHVHLKDYWMYLSEEGYRLVRSPLGQGVIDFPALLEIFTRVCPDVTLAIELGALEARHVRVLMADYWTEYPPRLAQQLAQVLRLAQKSRQPDADWRTPFERKETAEAIIAYEDQQLAASLEYIQQIRPLIV